MEAQAAARLGDEIAHGFGVAAMVAGAVAGALIGAAVVAATAATGGLAAVIIGGAIAAGGLSTFQIVKGISTIFNLPEPATGKLIRGSPDVFINNRNAMRAGEDVAASCSGFPFNHPYWPFPVKISEGSATVSINIKPAARISSKMTCGAHIKSGSPDTFIGGPPTRVGFVLDIESWLHTGLEVLGLAALAGGAILAASAGAAAFGTFALFTGGISGGMELLGDLGDRLGPGYRDLLQGTAGMTLLGLSPKMAKFFATADEPLSGSNKTLMEVLNEKLGNSSVNDALAAKRANPEFDFLTDNEYLAIRAYTSNLYEEINPALRNGELSEWGTLADEASSGLTKMTENGYGYKGITVRDATFTDKQIQDLFPEGGVFKDNGFSPQRLNLGGYSLVITHGLKFFQNLEQILKMYQCTQNLKYYLNQDLSLR